MLDASVSGTLGKMELKWKPASSVCVVMASGGYPGSYAKGKPIHGLAEAAKLPDTKVFHAGTALKDGQIVTNGGRVLGVTALGKDLRAAQAAAYAAVQKIHFDGAHFRRDIAAKAFKNHSASRDSVIRADRRIVGRTMGKIHFDGAHFRRDIARTEYQAIDFTERIEDERRFC